MLISMPILQKIKSKEITLLFRRWRKPTIKAGSMLKTAVGILEIQAIDPIETSDISDEDAQQAGYPDVVALLKEINKHEGALYRIALVYAGEDPRLQLRESDQLSEQDILILRDKLSSLDSASRVGEWTYNLMIAIEQNPMLSAQELAVKSGYEKDWLKQNVRKLKNLGLTISHDPGYSLSPRGIALLKTMK